MKNDIKVHKDSEMKALKEHKNRLGKE